MYANLHNFKTCITFDSDGILRWGFQHFVFLITVIYIMKSFKNDFWRFTRPLIVNICRVIRILVIEVY